MQVHPLLPTSPNTPVVPNAWGKCDKKNVINLPKKKNPATLLCFALKELKKLTLSKIQKTNIEKYSNPNLEPVSPGSSISWNLSRSETIISKDSEIENNTEFWKGGEIDGLEPRPPTDSDLNPDEVSDYVEYVNEKYDHYVHEKDVNDRPSFYNLMKSEIWSSCSEADKDRNILHQAIVDIIIIK
jgi:hypothetical protein